VLDRHRGPNFDDQIQLLADLEGGKSKLLALARESVAPYLPFPDVFEMYRAPSYFIGYFTSLSPEPRCLFNGLPAEKVRQLSRAGAYWVYTLGALEREGVQLSVQEEESVLERIWPVLMAAGTLTCTRAVRCCVADPVDQLLLAFRGANIRKCVARINRERKARRNGNRKRKGTWYAHLISPADEPLQGQDREFIPAAPRGKRSHKARGTRAEVAVAAALGGELVTGSGAGHEKGDVRAGDQRIEIKLAKKHWKIPLYQLRQLVRSGDVPRTVFLSGAGIPLGLRRKDDLQRDTKIVATRRVRPGQQTLTFSVRKYRRLLEGEENAAVELDLGALGNWLLVTVRALQHIPGRDALRHRAPATTSDEPAQ